MTAPVTKLLPLAVRVIAPFPATTEFGLSDDKTGSGLRGAVIVNPNTPEVPPPGVGLSTFTCAIPAVARSLAGIDARSSVAETNVVDLDMPFHWTIAPLTKLLPPTVSVIALLPALTVLGARDDKIGMGFEGATMVNVSTPEAPPPGAGLTTLTCTVPATVKSVAGIEATNSEAETNVVNFELPFH